MDRARFGLPQKYILFAGRLEPKKNVSALLQAYAWLRANRHLEHKVVLVGPEDCSDPAVARLLSQRELQAVVTRLPYISRDALVAIYNLADVFVFPSLAEGFGFPPLEAMACGAPVVASNIPVLRETLADAAITVPPDEPNLFAIAINKVVTNSFLRRTLVERGLDRVRAFNWLDVAKKIVEVYEAVGKKGADQT